MEYPKHPIILKVGLPLIFISDSYKLCFLVDAGVTHNILFSCVYEHLKHSFNVTREKFVLS